MKEKILVALKTKYKTFGFSDKAFDGVADYLSKTVMEESQIETAIGGVEGLLKSFQGEVDFVRNEKSGLQKQLDELKAKTGNPKPDPSPQPSPEGTPDMAKIIADAVSAAVKPLSDKLTQFETEKAQATRQEQILAKAKEYKIPESQAKRYSIPDDADLDAYFKEVKQELTNEGFEGVKMPESGDATPKSDDDAVAELIGKGTKEIVEQSKK